MAEFALHTKFANWQGDIKEGAIKQLANTADASFTKAGKQYQAANRSSVGRLVLLPAISRYTFYLLIANR
jgi:hypothetical protein